MNEETFKVRAYGFGELAQLYFPNITKKSASAQLRHWILNHVQTIKKLESLGYKSGKRVFTPAQVKVIVCDFGEP
jgi:hypothetical protein